MNISPFRISRRERNARVSRLFPRAADQHLPPRTLASLLRSGRDRRIRAVSSRLATPRKQFWKEELRGLLRDLSNDRSRRNEISEESRGAREQQI